MTELKAPKIVTREEWERARAELLVREKEHTHAGDALAAARRRLPMTRMEPVTVVGPSGPVPLQDVFEGRRMLIVYHFMWKKGAPHQQQCEGCTHSQVAMNAQVCAYLAARDVHQAMAALPDDQRIAIGLVLIEGLSYKDAAEVLKLPMGTVASRIVRGRMALMSQLQEFAT